MAIMNTALSALRLFCMQPSPLFSGNIRTEVRSSAFSHFIAPILIASAYNSIIDTTFANSLSNVLRIESSSYTGNITSRVSSLSTVSSFIFCNFLNITGATSGGAIYDSGGGNLTIAHSLFYGCQSTTNGGALYKLGGFAFLSRNCFYNCKVATTSVDGAYGNSFYFINLTSSLTSDSVFLCGDSITVSGDSSAVFEGGLYTATMENISKCMGYLCGCCYYHNGASPDSRLSFSIINKCAAVCIFEISSTLATMLNLNVVNNNVTTYPLGYSRAGNSTFENCAFFENTFSDGLSSFIFIDCIADFSGSGIVETNSVAISNYYGYDRGACYKMSQIFSYNLFSWIITPPLMLSFIGISMISGL